MSSRRCSGVPYRDNAGYVHHPAGVGTLASLSELKDMLVPVLVITPVSTVVVMAVSGKITQALIEGRKHERINRK